MSHQEKFTWYEFFAGGGMARLGLGEHWDCAFANEWCAKKASAYRAYFGHRAEPKEDELKEIDVALLTVHDLPGVPLLAWASFPCQDLSLAGMGAGLKGKRSGTFTPFWELMRDLIADGRAPKIITLENVVGAITSHGGKDLTVILNSLIQSGYRVGAIVIDALHFVPQSRSRLFIVAVRNDVFVPAELSLKWPDPGWHPRSLRKAYAVLPPQIQKHWIWWNLPVPTEPIQTLSDIIEKELTGGVKWHSKEQTNHLLAMMSDVNRAKLRDVQVSGELTIGTIYRRTRPDKNGRKVQRAEVRFDNISGCLRTPVGGSSRQTMLIVEGNTIRSRLLSPKEAARLMGVPENYPIPTNYNEAYHLFGDGVVVPVVRWLETHLLRPLAVSNTLARVSANVAR